METSSRTAAFVSRLVHSFSLKLVLLATVLLIVPLILYWQFQRAEHEQARLLRNSVNQSGRVIAAMLKPHFVKFAVEPPGSLREALQGTASGDVKVKVLLHLTEMPRDNFIYIAASPAVTTDYLNRERRELIQSGVFQRLAPTCEGTTDLAVRFVNPAGRPEILTSMTPVHVGSDCWIVITSQNASDLAPVRLDLPFFETPGMLVAAVIYVLSSVLVVWLLVHMWRNVSRFRTAARRIRMSGTGDVLFRDLNSIPELTRVAEDFDSLVAALMSSQAMIRQTAEENAHALKAPIAVIAQSIEPLKRIAGSQEPVARRSLQLIERSLAKLDSLVMSARDMENAAAEVVFPMRRAIDLSQFLTPLLAHYRETLSAQDKHLIARLGQGVTAYANEDLMEAVFENLLENAASFTGKGEKIEIALENGGDFAVLRVADMGPGVDPADMPRIFDRYFSRRPVAEGFGGEAGVSDHRGLGLWIVSRNVEGLGGSVMARNRESGGFEVTVHLRAAP